MPISIAETFVMDCIESEIAITGVDFFHIIEGKKIIPIDPINAIDNSSLELYEWKKYALA